MRQRRVKAFTLIEILIVLMIVGILVILLFQVYKTITEISARTRHEKLLSDSVISTQTIIQNIADTYTIDYQLLTGGAWEQGAQGWTKSIPLKDAQHQPATLLINSGSMFFTTQTGTITLLPANIAYTGLFLIAPAKDPASGTAFNDIYQPGFWMFGTMYNVVETGIRMPIDTLYTLLQN